MFRLYLVNLIKSVGTKGKAETQSASHPTFDRRVYNRFNIEHKHMTMLNNQDIFLIRNISLRGFCTDVSERSYQKLKLGMMIY